MRSHELCTRSYTSRECQSKSVAVHCSPFLWLRSLNRPSSTNHDWLFSLRSGQQAPRASYVLKWHMVALRLFLQRQKGSADLSPIQLPLNF